MTPPGAALPGSILAHGIGGRQDLPIPFGHVLVGAAAALLVSFAVLAFAWRRPRYDAASAGVPLPGAVQAAVSSRWWTLLGQALGLLLTAYALIGALLGPDLATNPTAGVVYVLFWIGLVPVSVLLGPVWRWLNPLRTLHALGARAVRADPKRGLLDYPERLGHWPAAVVLLAFTWLELVAPDNVTLPVIRAWFAGYLALTLVGAAVYGSRWFERADAFEVYSTLLGRLSPLGRRGDGRLVLRSPLSGLDGVPPLPGLVAVVCVLLGSTAYDSFSSAPVWVRLVQGGALPETLAGTLGLVGMVALVAATYAAAATLAGGVAGEVPGGGAGSVAGGRRTTLPGRFAHSLVPIVVGYLVAHYLTLLVLEGQRTVIYLSDPLSSGADWLGTAGRGVDQTLATMPALIASVQVLAVVTGHVLGVVAAHDRSVRLFRGRAALLGQLPLLGVMVGYTVGGLLLLFAA